MKETLSRMKGVLIDWELVYYPGLRSKRCAIKIMYNLTQSTRSPHAAATIAI